MRFAYCSFGDAGKDLSLIELCAVVAVDQNGVLFRWIAILGG